MNKKKSAKRILEDIRAQYRYTSTEFWTDQYAGTRAVWDWYSLIEAIHSVSNGGWHWAWLHQNNIVNFIIIQ